MNLETLPSWFWLMYYLFLLVTIAVAIHSITKRKITILSIITIITTITLPPAFIIEAMGRYPGLNEFEFLIIQLQEGYKSSAYVALCHLMLVVWWVTYISVLITGKRSQKGES
ncbi:hypothetical protein VQL36_04950 [Chengkuizengella sp. SCS-71B]|uniref:hypothetical protein n=1 Tax=Chengkuizengella sp. SCS-71B TaxID=3115290 RepID=UPI0032C23652